MCADNLFFHFFKMCTSSQIKDFQSAHRSELRASTRDVQQAVEAAENNVKWMERNFGNIWGWLRTQQRLVQ